MKIKFLQRLLLITSPGRFFRIPGQGQSLKEAIDAYNTGLELAGTDIEAAIEHMEKSREMASLLGPEGEEVREQAEIQIPGMYYDKAMGHYRERNIEQAIEVSKRRSGFLKNMMMTAPKDGRKMYCISYMQYRQMPNSGKTITTKPWNCLTKP
jgi:hypothetical protein